MLNHIRRAALLTTCLTLPFTTLPVRAANFTVTNVNDAGAGSLRDAISQAEGNPGADTIDYGAGFQGTTALTTGGLTITQSLTVDFKGDPQAGGNRIGGTFGVTVNAPAQTVTLNGVHTYTGDTTLASGILSVGGPLDGDTDNGVFSASDSLLSMGAGTQLNIAAGQRVSFANISGSGMINNNSGTTVAAGVALLGDTAGTMRTFSGGITGDGAVTMFGGAHLTVSGTNTYSGGTNLFASVSFNIPDNFTTELRAGAANTFSPNSAFSIVGGATLNLNSFNQTIGSLDGGTLGGTPLVSLGSATLTTGGDNTSTEYSGSISGTGGLTKTGTGVQILSPQFGGVVNYSGTTEIQAGTLRAGVVNAFSASSSHNLTAAGATLDLNGFNQTVAGLVGVAGSFVTLGAGTLTVGDNNTTGFNGVISGSGGLTKVGAGALNLFGNNTYTGPTNVNESRLALNRANVLSTQTAVTIAAGADIQSSADQSVGSLAGAGELRISGGEFVVGNNNTSTTFSGVIVGAVGRFLEKVGTGTMTISGNSPNFFGEIEVNGGTLVHNGDTRFGSLSVFAGTTLMGTGRAGTTTIIGTLAPGNSIGTITTGSIFFGANSTYVVEVNPTAADRTNANGTAQITGGTVNVIAASGQYAQTQTYTILNSTGLLTGTFAGATSNLAFLAPSLTYDANNVYLTLVSNGVSVAQFGQTPNQRATAAGLAGAGPSAPYIGPFSSLAVGDVPGALDQTSGDAHASIKGIFVEDSGSVRDAAFDRVAAAFDALTNVGAMNAFVATDTDPDDPSLLAGKVLWGQLQGSAGTINADGNAAQTAFTSGGILLGTDGQHGNWHIGVLAGAGLTGINARNTTGQSTDLSLGVYGGTEVGDGIVIKLGAALTGHIVRTTRTITLPGIADTVTAAYGARTLQAFGELSKEFDLGAVELTPFGQLALVSHSTDAFTETGAPGALSSAASTINAAFVTLGVRAEHQFVLGDGMMVTASGSIGWRHAFADMPTATNSFAAGGPFTVSGAPIARDSLVLSAALDFDLSDELDLRLSYDGALGGGTASHAVKLTLSGEF